MNCSTRRSAASPAGGSVRSGSVWMASVTTASVAQRPRPHGASELGYIAVDNEVVSRAVAADLEAGLPRVELRFGEGEDAADGG